MNEKISVVLRPILSSFPKMKDFSKLGLVQAVTYSVKVVVSKKWCWIDTLLLHNSVPLRVAW